MRGNGIDAAALSINRPVLVEHKRGLTDTVPGRLKTVFWVTASTACTARLGSQARTRW